MRWETRVALPLSERASAGLAAAIALRRQGFEVQVYEQAPELAEFGAGINISPNSVKFFRRRRPRRQAACHRIRAGRIDLARLGLGRDSATCLPFGDFEKRYGAKYYVVHRSDLHRLLSEAVPQASIQLGKRCTQVESRNGSAGLSFADGTSAEADVVVGCDGIRSAVRACLFGGEGPHYAGTMCWRALAPSDALPKDYHDRYVNQWSGDGGFVISYYIRQGKFINFVCVRQQPGWTEQSWSVPSSVDEMLAAFPNAGDKAAQDDGGSDVLLEMGAVHRRARAAMDQRSRHPARRFRARHAGDLRARRQHGFRGRLCSGAMA